MYTPAVFQPRPFPSHWDLTRSDQGDAISNLGRPAFWRVEEEEKRNGDRAKRDREFGFLLLLHHPGGVIVET
jgi:hypothetical protein